MKKIILFVNCIFASVLLMAQEPADALRYSWIVPSGSARQQAIGGAMGSLGGDITATFVNPAGLGFYKTGDVVFTPLYGFGKNRATYFDTARTDKNNRFAIGASGFVFGDGDNGRKVKSSAFSIAINRMADFNSNIIYRGGNTKSSYSQKFLEELKNVHDSTAAFLFPFGPSLAINTFWIDTANGWKAGNRTFQSLAVPYLPDTLYQQNTINSKGSMAEFALGFGANLNDKIMLGGSLGIPIIHYERTTEFLEANANYQPGDRFDYAIFSDKLSVQGRGINLKAGIIYKPQDSWRIGLAVHSPSFIKMTENYEAVITAKTNVIGNTIYTQSSKDFTNNEPSQYKYILMTPYRIIGSISYVLREVQDVTKQKGFITADVEYVNYKASSFFDDPDNNSDQSTKDYLKSLNNAIDNYYKGVLNFRVGGELKFTTIMVRAGVAYYGNPYKDTYGESGSKLNLSGGLGYRNKGIFIDITYVHSINKDVNLPYRLQTMSNYGAAIRSINGTALATVGFKF